MNHVGLLCFLGLLAGSSPAGTRSVSLVETAPMETTLDHPDVPDTWRVWPEMIDGARETLEFAGFYFSNREGSRLETVLRSILAAGARGVEVRVLADAGFYRTYPRTLDRLARAPGVAVRLIDFRSLSGGPMHAKYFLVDRTEAFVGSQNFDWRALEHIHETGLRIRVPGYVRALSAVFWMDWNEGVSLEEPTFSGPGPGAAARGPSPPFPFLETSGDTAHLWPAFSPPGRLPEAGTWDLEQIVDMVDTAEDSIRMTGLSYSPVTRDGSYWEEVDNALRRAAVRGVRVKLLVSDWNQGEPAIDFLKSLHLVPGIEVRLATIPEASSGFIPYARVTHSKYLTVDGARCWLGTSNWEKSYFWNSRNVGLVARSREVTRALDRDFDTLWHSSYASPVRPEAAYEPPRIRD